ncbi:hypothetical protein COT78_00880 [Candidatus Berkelbacteria bacterium CG10_big_fil_rev_8_21_14_0_10_43_13]|uniref:Uncharacterized protein n=1 Tax=Candidatus Berkelbacteria bacterium CG10_big_fil_rev_8_21_14_0_10_43_13 TaxID=1974514 RepID=A0A2H0W7F3_9BACT|nr:MAG: hypothetical protein COT78_00880 [Candidatus Berkelbacteria bacterium CG10_big_fil_rev_8_21_14_0_10_43_13]
MSNSTLIEKKLIGRPYWQAPILTARINVKNNIAHSLAAVKAIESACNIQVSTQTKKLRQLLLIAEFIKNHTKKLYHEILPDFLDLETVSEIAKLHPEIYHNAINLIDFSNQILTLIGGRTLYSIANVTGGFKSYPTKSEFKQLAVQTDNLIVTARQTLNLCVSLKLQSEKLNGDFAALHANNDYAYYDGEIWTDAGKLFTQDDFQKFAQSNLDKTVFGPIARYNLSQSHFDTTTKNLIDELKIKKQFQSISDNIIATAIELNFFVGSSIKIIDGFSNLGPVREHIIPPRSFSIGTAAIESAGGTIIHHCELDKDGIITKYEIFIP